MKRSLLVLNSSKLLKRWEDSQGLIFNIYYYNITPLLFGSFDFKNEILAVNWNYLKIDINFWRYSYPFFIFKTNKYDTKTKHFYNKINLHELNMFFISNPNFHFKNLYYFSQQRFFTLAIIPSNISPWLVSYPIPVLAINHLMEYYFLKLLIFLEKNAILYKYNFLKLQWKNTHLLKNSILF